MEIDSIYELSMERKNIHKSRKKIWGSETDIEEVETSFQEMSQILTDSWKDKGFVTLRGVRLLQGMILGQQKYKLPLRLLSLKVLEVIIISFFETQKRGLDFTEKYFLKNPHLCSLGRNGSSQKKWPNTVINEAGGRSQKAKNRVNSRKNKNWNMSEPVESRQVNKYWLSSIGLATSWGKHMK